MEYRKFGRLGWEVSAVSLGTVQLGMPYGFTYEGEAEVPSRRDGIRLLLDAFESGINLVDTAPTYGAAEEIAGEALRQWKGSKIFVATKIPTWGNDLAISVEQSLRKLGRESVDLLQIYSHSDDWNAVLRSLEIALNCQDTGKIRAIGISIYDEAIALKALELEEIQAIQLPFNMLDQRMAIKVLPAAARNLVGVLGRSTLLKGVLTDRRQLMPSQFGSLVEMADRLAVRLREVGLGLPAGALRFAVSNKGLTSVLIGARNRTELNAAIGALESRVDLDWSVLQEGFSQPNSSVDPRTWPA